MEYDYARTKIRKWKPIGTHHYTTSIIFAATICPATRKRGRRIFPCNPHENVGCIILALCDFVVGVAFSLPVVARPAFQCLQRAVSSLRVVIVVSIVV